MGVDKLRQAFCWNRDRARLLFRHGRNCNLERMQIRSATLADVPAMTECLNWAIRETDFIFRDTEATIAEREETLRQNIADGCPWLVAETEPETPGEKPQHLGWARYHPHRDPSVWKGCYETTIYLDPAAQGQGVGTALLGELVSLARADEKVHTLLALIVDTNIASIKLHEKFGFANVGKFKEVSYKMGHWINLTHLQLML